MPVQCPIDFPRIDEREMGELDYQVMKHAFAAQNNLGCLADEEVYQRELLRRLRIDGIQAVIEVPLQLSFRDFATPLRLDLVVENKSVYELKTVSALTEKHSSQLLEYLFLTNTTRGKLINFRPRRVESRFANTSLTLTDRRKFGFVNSAFHGSEDFAILIRELVEDWGTGLDGTLYRRAITHCLGRLAESECLLPMVSGGISVGNQRFHLLESNSAIGVTTFRERSSDNRTDFKKLIACSDLKQLHWVNIYHHQVQVETIFRL